MFFRNLFALIGRKAPFTHSLATESNTGIYAHNITPERNRDCKR